METEKNPNMIRNIAIGIGIAIVVIGFIVFAVAKSKSNVFNTTTSASVQAPTPVDCKYTWSDWICDNTAKQATRTPQVTTEASGGGQECPAPEIKDCNDCEVTWGDWICNDSTGKATKTPVVTNPASGGGQECPAPEIQDCNDCKFTWSEWGCDSTTGKATKTPVVTKAASGGGKQCPDPEIQGCNDCQYTWGNWECDDKTGVATRKAVVSKQQSIGGKACPVPETQDCANCKFTWNDAVCNTTTGKSLKSPNITTPGFGGGVLCPVPVEGDCARDCQFNWGGWQCDRTTGVSKRDPIITASPLLSGQQCPTTDTKTCEKDCQYTWGDWQCDKTTGVKKRSPNVTAVASNGGVVCPAAETGPCDVDCVVNYPTEWGVCDPATGKQTMNGTVATARQNNGKACDPLVKTQDCKVDCQIEWSNVWGPCNYLTESQGRNGVVAVTAKNGGAACGPLSETQNCTPSAPYVYTTQIFAGQKITGVNYTSFSQSGIPEGWGPVNFTSYGGLCVIDLNFTAWTLSENNLGTFAVIIDGVAQLPLIKFSFNQAGVHCTVPGVYLSVYLSPGVHTIGLYVNYTPTNLPVSVDIYDNIWLRVIEYSQSLVGGPNPLVYVTTIFNQTNSGSSSYNESGIPPNWTKSAITHGGQCMIDLNFSAYNKNANQGVNFALMIDGHIQLPLIYYMFSRPNKHQTITASFTTISLDPGTHTFAIYISWGASGATVDPWDYLNMRITEFRNNLTMSTPKLINVIPLLSMIKPTSGVGISPSSQTPGNWTKIFTTNGGTCAFNISNTFVSTSVVGYTMITFNITNAGSSAITSSPGTVLNYTNSGGDINITNYFHLNLQDEHATVNCNFIITGLPAGSHTFSAWLPAHYPGKVVCDGTDTLNVRIIEFSPTLTSGTPPALPAALTASTKPNFKGCYTDNVNSQRVFNQMVDNQTLGQCNTLAKTAGSPYFGMQSWQKSGGVTAMDTGECWFQKGSTLQSAQSQGSSTSCQIGTGQYNIGGSNTNAVYQTL